MELRHLRYFIGVARELNFTRAARKLRVAQPALSRQIRQLEEEIGVPLFERHQRGVKLTEAGQVFWREASALLAQSERAIRETHQTGVAAQGELNLGYVWGLFHSRVPNTLIQFRQRFPNVAVNVLDLTATQQADALLNGDIDVGFIGFADEAEAAQLGKQKIGRCDFVAVLPVDHPSARKSKVDLHSLAEEYFVVISERNYPGAARLVSQICAAAGFRPKILKAADRGYTLLGLVAGHCGVSLLPEPLKALPHPGVVFRPLARPAFADLHVAWNPARLSSLAKDFLENLA